jgi:hypothetical protein
MTTRGVNLEGTAANIALQRTRRPRIRSGRSLRSLGSPLNARPLGAEEIALVAKRRRCRDDQ